MLCMNEMEIDCSGRKREDVGFAPRYMHSMSTSPTLGGVPYQASSTISPPLAKQLTNAC